MVKLSNNKDIALKSYNQQLLNKNLQDKADLITSENKLQRVGHVDYVQNLSQEQQRMLSERDMKYLIPWRVVWKQNSISPPVELYSMLLK